MAVRQRLVVHLHADVHVKVHVKVNDHDNERGRSLGC